MQAAESEEDEEEDGLLKPKMREESEARIVENTEVTLEEFVKKNKKKGAPGALDLVEKFWGEGAQLDDTDKFLRNYVLAEGWKGGSVEKPQEVDLEDELREEEMEDYEERYNFRFEEK